VAIGLCPIALSLDAIAEIRKMMAIALKRDRTIAER
jgi:hypothetical protein